MTKEQEEAIEIFEGLKRNKEIIKDIDKDYFFTFGEIIINLIQEQQKEIETKQNRIQELEKALIDDDYKYREEMKQKDKMIDETIGFIATRTWATCPNEDCGANLDCENRCSNDDNIYEECWKMYFENQAKM